MGWRPFQGLLVQGSHTWTLPQVRSYQEFCALEIEEWGTLFLLRQDH